MALVVTLSLVVLVTIAALAFFTRAMANRTVEASRANQVLASQIARSAQDYVASRFLQELRENATIHSTNGTTIYQVTNPLGMLPRRALAETSMTNSPDFSNLIRQSVPGADPAASSDSTAVPSQNERLVNNERWNTPRLLSGSGFANTNQLPNWVYLLRNGTVTGNLTSSETPQVIGRFAYNIYETGGLLNANVAGFPSTVSGSALQAIKGTLAGADLTALGISTSAIDALVAFRNPQATNSATYTNYVAGARKGGFLDAVVPNGSGSGTSTNQFFASRQDLIRYATTQNPGLTNALPFLTHTARFSTAPSWGPTTPPGSSIDYTANSNNSTASNRFLPNVRVQAGFTRPDGTLAQPGEPLLKRKFPLSRLAWVGPNGPVAPGDSGSIQQNFGLLWNPDNRRWDYVGHTGNTVQIGIKTLQQVASEGREPNFFELLKAGILSGSVGKAADQKTLAGNGFRTLEDDEDLQILRIGANLIDQADTDNLPTAIHLAGVSQLGVEDLPYLYTMPAGVRWRYRVNGAYTSSGINFFSPVNISLEGYALIWAPKLFRPHVSSQNPASTPTQIRVRLASGTISSINQLVLNLTFGNSTQTQLQVNAPIDLTNLGQTEIRIPATNFANFSAEPKVVPENEASNTASAIYRQLSVGFWNTGASSGGDTACGFVPFQMTSTTNHTVTATGSPADFRLLIPRVRVEGLMVLLEAWDGAAWRPYDALAGNPGLSVTGISTAAPTNEWDQGGVNFGNNQKAQPYGNSIGGSMHAVYKPDLRTTRWAASHGWEEGRNGIAAPGATQGFRLQKPFAAPTLTAPQNPTNITDWPRGSTSASNNQAPGADGIWRPNDAYLGANANLFSSLSDSNRRPIILQRPFRTVAEMGYAFRDTPWQSLNFFHSLSGDSALLDLFCIEEEPAITAGKVNLNTASRPVLQALLQNFARFPDDSVLFTATTAQNTANNLITFRQAQTGLAFRDKTALADFVSSTQNTDSEVLKTRREAVVRALADVGETRTWNLFADIIVQAGRFLPGAAQFTTEAENRVWVDLTLDRMTGSILNLASEPITQ